MDIEGGLGQFTDLRMGGMGGNGVGGGGGLGKKDGGGVFLGGGYTPMHTMLSNIPTEKASQFHHTCLIGPYI